MNLAASDESADRFATVVAESESSQLVSGSKFIALLSPAQSVDAAESILNLRRRRYPDATHHCWAYRVGRPEPLAERSSDDGEPSGTAGRPIADALRGGNLENIVCVVTRYFGGTKLGTGGLVRAYGDAARAAIESEEIISRTVVRELQLDFDHDRTGVIYRALEEFGLHLVAGDYDTRAHGTVLVPRAQVERLRHRICELTLSGVEFTEGGLSLR